MKDKCPLCGGFGGKHIPQCNAKDIHKNKINRFKSRDVKKKDVVAKLIKQKNRSNNKTDK